jgi:hypothetical protein
MELPDRLKNALCHLGNDPTTTVVTWGVIHELIDHGMIECQGGEIRFSEAGRKLFHEIRGTWPKRLV